MFDLVNYTLEKEHKMGQIWTLATGIFLLMPHIFSMLQKNTWQRRQMATMVKVRSDREKGQSLEVYKSASGSETSAYVTALIFSKVHCWPHHHHSFLGAGNSSLLGEARSPYTASGWNKLNKVMCISHSPVYSSTLMKPYTLSVISCWWTKENFTFSS